MRHVAALPAIGLLVGSACGLGFPDNAPLAVPALLACAALAAMAWGAEQPKVLAAAVLVGFGAGGALLSADAWREAWRPPLRIAFEEIAASEDGTAFVVVTGVLRCVACARSACSSWPA